MDEVLSVYSHCIIYRKIYIYFCNLINKHGEPKVYRKPPAYTGSWRYRYLIHTKIRSVRTELPLLNSAYTADDEFLIESEVFTSRFQGKDDCVGKTNSFHHS